MAIVETVKVLVDCGMLVQEGIGYRASALAQAAAVCGLSAAGARYIIRVFSSAPELSDLQIIYRLLQSPEGESIYLPGGRRRPGGPVSTRLYETAGQDPLWQEISTQSRSLTEVENSRLILTMLLSDWAAGSAVLEIENIYSLYPGLVEDIARQAAWLASSSASVIRAVERFSPLAGRFRDLAFCLASGLPLETRPLHEHVGSLFFRREYMQLLRQDLIYPGCDIDRIREKLPEMIQKEQRRNEIDSKLREIKEEQKMNKGKNLPVAVEPDIEIVGTPVRERYRVRINGHAIDLTSKSFKYFLGLVWSRLTKENGWLYKEELEQGFNQARYLYRLRQEIGRDFMPEWPLYENNRSGYYRLVADPGKITVNVDALKNIPDYEIQKMVADLRPAQVN